MAVIRNRPRIRIRVGVRGLMLAVLLLGGLLGWKANRVSIQRRAVAEIKRAGGNIVYDYEYSEGSKWCDREPGTPLWLRRAFGDEFFQEVASVDLGHDDESARPRRPDERTVAAIARLDRLEELWLDMPSLSDADLARLPRRIKRLHLRLHSTTEEGLAHLIRMRALEKLELRFDGVRLTRATLDRIADLDQLRELRIGRGSGWNDPADLAPLARLTRLDSLHMECALPEGGAWLVHLRGLSGLRRLSLPGAVPSDSDLANLVGLTNLEELDFDSSKITDAGLVHLGALSQLTELFCSSSRITDAGMVHLAKLANLTELSISEAALTDTSLPPRARSRRVEGTRSRSRARGGSSRSEASESQPLPGHR